jgi:hypothetical protein
VRRRRDRDGERVALVRYDALKWLDEAAAGDKPDTKRKAFVEAVDCLREAHIIQGRANRPCPVKRLWPDRTRNPDRQDTPLRGVRGIRSVRPFGPKR